MTEAAQDRSLVSLVVPCYNEIGNVEDMANALVRQMEELVQYEYEIIFIDNYSTDGTRDKLREITASNRKIKAILNTRNFGQFNSPYYGLCQASGDCAIAISCDFQDPVELIPEMLAYWSDGAKIVCPVKTESDESKAMYFLRSCYYRFIQKMSSVDQIEHFTGFGLYDRIFLNTMRDLKDPTPFLRGIVAELGPADRICIPYHQADRRRGKSHNNFWSLYDGAMLSFTSYAKAPMRIATILGFIVSCFSILAAIVYFVLKLIRWDVYPAGSIPILLAVLVLGSLQLFFLGLLGEYVISINARSMRRPLVVEEERLGEWNNK